MDIPFLDLENKYLSELRHAGGATQLATSRTHAVVFPDADVAFQFQSGLKCVVDDNDPVLGSRC